MFEPPASAQNSTEQARFVEQADICFDCALGADAACRRLSSSAACVLTNLPRAHKRNRVKSRKPWVPGMSKYLIDPSLCQALHVLRCNATAEPKQTKRSNMTAAAD